MSSARFADRLERSWAQRRYLCVGIDPTPADLAIAYKPNAAFYERFGPLGMAARVAAALGHPADGGAP